MDHTTSKDGHHPDPCKDKDLLTALPNECLAHITKYLPVREIPRLRGQNRRFRDFIDTNERELVADVIRHHRDRIHSEHRLLTDSSGRDAVDILRYFYRHYGRSATGASIQNPALNMALSAYICPLLPIIVLLSAFFRLLAADDMNRVDQVVHFDEIFEHARVCLPGPVLADLAELGK
jgi:hypothetical protein